MSATPLGEGGLSQMTVCLEMGRAAFWRKGRSRSCSVRCVPVYPMPRQFPHKGDVVAPLVPARSQIGKVGINDGRRARSSSRRGRRFLFQGTVDPARTDADELGNLLFVAALSIQFPDPLMHAYSLAMTRTTLSRNFFRYCRPLSRTCFACAALYRLFRSEERRVGKECRSR